MRMQVIVSLLALAMAGCGGASSTDVGSTHQPIVDGVLDGNAHPNVGAIVTPIEVAGAPPLSPFCSGTLINHRVFLTAGHCTQILQQYQDAGVPVTQLVFVTFAQDTRDESALRPIQGWETMPGLEIGADGNTKPNTPDVGVVILPPGETDDLSVARLAPENYLDEPGVLHRPVTIVGYGFTLDATSTPVENYDRYEKRGKLLGLESTEEDLITNGPCYADSGGPTFAHVDGRGFHGHRPGGWGHGGRDVIISTHISINDTSCQSTANDQRMDLPDVHAFIDGVIDSL